MSTVLAIRRHHEKLVRCTLCPKMIGTPVHGEPVLSPVMLVGQAPGSKEVEVKRPFAWTAGKTLFGWFRDIGLDEAQFRGRVYMTAVCRCFPGKNPKGGDRVPDRTEIQHCSTWLQGELRMLRPRLVLPVGKLAIATFFPVDKLSDVVGRVHRIALGGVPADIVPLPHPSGASTWHRTEPGKTLLREALALVARHEAWRALCEPPGSR